MYGKGKEIEYVLLYTEEILPEIEEFVNYYYS